MISMNKKYTLFNKPFTVLTVTKPGIYPVLGYLPNGSSYSFTKNGVLNYGDTSLVEVSRYADFKIDEPVMVRDFDLEEWTRANFVGVDKLGIAKASRFCSWVRQSTSALTWDQCRRPTAKELAE